MLIDQIITKFEKIHQNLELIKSNLPEEELEFTKLGLVKDGIYKRYEYSVEIILDIIAMINSHYKFGIPNNMIEMINNLNKNSVLSLKTCNIIQGMKAFRNVLVHVYDKLDDILAFNNIRSNLADFSIIEDEIIAFLKKQK